METQRHSEPSIFKAMAANWVGGQPPSNNNNTNNGVRFSLPPQPSAPREPSAIRRTQSDVVVRCTVNRNRNSVYYQERERRVLFRTASASNVAAAAERPQQYYLTLDQCQQLLVQHRQQKPIQKRPVERLRYNKLDILTLVQESDCFRILQNTLRQRGAITNELLLQGLPMFMLKNRTVILERLVVLQQKQQEEARQKQEQEDARTNRSQALGELLAAASSSASWEEEEDPVPMEDTHDDDRMDIDKSHEDHDDPTMNESEQDSLANYFPELAKTHIRRANHSSSNTNDTPSEASTGTSSDQSLPGSELPHHDERERQQPDKEKPVIIFL